MKKYLIRGLLVLLLLGIVGFGLLYFSLNGIVKSGVSKYGSAMTKTDTKVEGVSISMFGGSGSIKQLFVGVPQGFKAPFSMKVDDAKLAVAPMSLLGDKIVVKEILVANPEITFEGSLAGNNLTTIQRNVEEYTATEEQATTGPKPPKLQVDHFKISGAKVHLALTFAGGKGVAIPLPDLELSNLGTGPDGITAGELTKQITQLVVRSTIKAVTENLGNLGPEVTNALKGLGGAGIDTIKGAAEGVGNKVGDLLKRK